MEKLFYKDPYLKEFDGEVLSAALENGAWKVVLSATAFYPEGGGQPADHGKLIRADGSEVLVTDVHEKDGQILHTVTGPVLAGETIHGVIDWERRFDHMQQHSGEHIVSGMICEMFSCDNVGFHMGSDIVTIDYNARISFEEIMEVERRANAYIWENHGCEIHVYRDDRLSGLVYRSKKELTGDVRIVSFPGADTCACCGTHVKESGEVGIAKFVSAQGFHGGTRFEVCFGKRAYDLLNTCFEQNREVGVMLNAHMTTTAEVVRKTKEDLAAAKVALANTEEKYFRELAKTYAGAGDVLIVTEGLSPDSVRKMAVIIGETCGGRAAVFSADSADSRKKEDVVPWKYAMVHPGQDITPFVKQMNTLLNGRGGGKSGFAQGSAQTSEEQIRAFFSGPQE